MRTRHIARRTPENGPICGKSLLRRQKIRAIAHVMANFRNKTFRKKIKNGSQGL